MYICSISLHNSLHTSNHRHYTICQILLTNKGVFFSLIKTLKRFCDKYFCVSNRSMIITMRQLEEDQVDKSNEETMKVKSRQSSSGRKIRGMEREAQADMFPWAKRRDLG